MNVVPDMEFAEAVRERDDLLEKDRAEAREENERRMHEERP